MVIKPQIFIGRGKNGLVQPALKCRGREYLRIIYGAEYTADEHLDRLRKRSVSAKRSLALREFALGMEAIERFRRLSCAASLFVPRGESRSSRGITYARRHGRPIRSALPRHIFDVDL